MKVRVSENCIRLRLGRDDIGRLDQHTSVKTTCRFPDGGSLSFELYVDSGLDSIRAFLDGSHSRIALPATLIEGWLDDDREGFSAILDAGSGRGLEVKVEKDYKCLHKKSDDAPGAFPHPKGK